MNIYIPLMKFTRSGGSRVLAMLANGLAHRGHSVTIVVPISSDKPYYPISDLVKIHYLNHYSGTRKQPQKPPIRQTHPLYTLIKIKKYLAATCLDTDIIIANENLTAYPVAALACGIKIYYIQAYEPDFYTKPKHDIRLKLKALVAWFSYYLPLNRIVNAPIYKDYKNIRTSYVSLPGIDRYIFTPRIGWKRDPEQLTVGCVGRVEPWKGTRIVAEAVSELRQKRYKINLKTAFNYQPGAEQELVNPQNDKELADFYKSVDVMITPGLIQMGSIHYPVIEAMASNVPLITAPYFPANDDNALISKPGCTYDLAKNIEQVYNDYSGAERRAHRAMLQIEQFDWDYIIKNFETTLLEIVSSHQ